MKSIIIFGGSGYVGRNLIRRFANDRYKVIVPYQSGVRTLVKSEIQMIDITLLFSVREFGHGSNFSVVVNLSTPTSSTRPILSKYCIY